MKKVDDDGWCLKVLEIFETDSEHIDFYDGPIIHFDADFEFGVLDGTKLLTMINQSADPTDGLAKIENRSILRKYELCTYEYFLND